MFYICRSCSAAASEACFVIEYCHSLSCAWAIHCGVRGVLPQMLSVSAGEHQDQEGQHPVIICLPMLGSRLQVVCDSNVFYMTFHMDMSGEALLRMLVMKGFQHPVGRIPEHAGRMLHLQHQLWCQNATHESIVLCRTAAQRCVVGGRDGMTLSFAIHSRLLGADLVRRMLGCGLQTTKRRTPGGSLGALSNVRTMEAPGIQHGALFLCR